MNSVQGAAMEFSSLHTHTVFCDGADDIETMCQAAFEKGLCGIGFSAHAPIFKKTGIRSDWHMSDERLREYIDEVRAARCHWEGKLAVFLGMELDYIKGLCCAMDADIRALDLDYIIGSVHYLLPANGAQPFTVDGPPEEFERGIAEGFGGDGEAAMHAYWDAVAEMTAIGGFEILGHADLIRKNNENKRWFDTESADWRRRLAETAAAASRCACVAELNTGGLNRGRGAGIYPSLPLLRILCEKNVAVTITADAHRADDLDGHYECARQALLEAGYGEHMLFKGKIAGHAAWRNAKL